MKGIEFWLMSLVFKSVIFRVFYLLSLVSILLYIFLCLLLFIVVVDLLHYKNINNSWLTQQFCLTQKCTDTTEARWSEFTKKKQLHDINITPLNSLYPYCISFSTYVYHSWSDKSSRNTFTTFEPISIVNSSFNLTRTGMHMDFGLECVAASRRSLMHSFSKWWWWTDDTLFRKKAKLFYPIDFQ